MHTIHELLTRLWDDYALLNLQVPAICQLIEQRGDTVVNDHIALRTYSDPRIGIDVLADSFVRLGYCVADDYEFPEKHLTARHYEHTDPKLPKVFISQLEIDAFSPVLGQLVNDLIDQVPTSLTKQSDFSVSGRPWQLSYQTYAQLASESEYAAWMSAFGFRANHFTILVNALTTFNDLQSLNSFLKDHGHALNTSGGEIKGSPQVWLEQSSTLADKVEVQFTDDLRMIPACYYEFARRYPKPDGRLFQGFVAKSADKIFESTDRR